MTNRKPVKIRHCVSATVISSEGAGRAYLIKDAAAATEVMRLWEGAPKELKMCSRQSAAGCSQMQPVQRFEALTDYQQ